MGQSVKAYCLVKISVEVYDQTEAPKETTNLTWIRYKSYNPSFFSTLTDVKKRSQYLSIILNIYLSCNLLSSVLKDELKRYVMGRKVTDKIHDPHKCVVISSKPVPIFAYLELNKNGIKIIISVINLPHVNFMIKNTIVKILRIVLQNVLSIGFKDWDMYTKQYSNFEIWSFESLSEAKERPGYHTLQSYLHFFFAFEICDDVREIRIHLS